MRLQGAVALVVPDAGHDRALQQAQLPGGVPGRHGTRNPGLDQGNLLARPSEEQRGGHTGDAGADDDRVVRGIGDESHPLSGDGVRGQPQGRHRRAFPRPNRTPHTPVPRGAAAETRTPSDATRWDRPGMGTGTPMSDAQQMTSVQRGGFHSPEQEWPDATDEMRPRPDHGEQSYDCLLY